MNIIEAIKEFQTGKYDYMTHNCNPTLHYTIGAAGCVVCGDIECHLTFSYLNGWEMGPKKKVEKTGWINIYCFSNYNVASRIYDTKEDALTAQDVATILDTVQITYHV